MDHCAAQTHLKKELAAQLQGVWLADILSL